MKWSKEYFKNNQNCSPPSWLDASPWAEGRLSPRSVQSDCLYRLYWPRTTACTIYAPVPGCLPWGQRMWIDGGKPIHHANWQNCSKHRAQEWERSGVLLGFEDWRNATIKDMLCHNSPAPKLMEAEEGNVNYIVFEAQVNCEDIHLYTSLSSASPFLHPGFLALTGKSWWGPDNPVSFSASIFINHWAGLGRTFKYPFTL